jgi:hypothetical protein
MNPRTNLSLGGAYPLGDPIPCKLRLSRPGALIMARWTGTTRPPRKGEWYLSGALIEAYRAPKDLDASYPIAELVEAIVTTTYRSIPE